MKTLYHGTSGIQGTKIIHERILKVSSSENTPYAKCSGNLRTTMGFVYMTNYENKALQFAKNACRNILEQSNKIRNNPNYSNVINCNLNSIDLWDLVYIFEISIDEKELLPDLDQCNVEKKEWKKQFTCTICNFTNCLYHIKSTRCKRNLHLKFDVVRYKVLRYHRDNSLVQDWTNL